MAGKSREITPSSPSEFLGQTVEIVAAYVAHNALSPGDLTRTLAGVHQALRSLGTAGINAVPSRNWRRRSRSRNRLRQISSSALRMARSSNR